MGADFRAVKVEENSKRERCRISVFLLGMSVVLAQETLGITLRSGEGKSRHLSPSCPELASYFSRLLHECQLVPGMELGHSLHQSPMSQK